MHYLLRRLSRLRHTLHSTGRHCCDIAIFTLVILLVIQWAIPLRSAYATPSAATQAEQPTSKPTTNTTVTQEVFQSYKDLNDFMEQSPQVTELGSPEALDVMQYGPDVLKTITGPDCNRDGKLDDLTMCRKEFYRLWLKFQQ